MIKRKYKKIVSCLLGMAAGCWFTASSAYALSMNVVDGDVREVLRSVSRLGNINMVLDDSVGGTVSVKLEEVGPDEALRYIAATKGLMLVKENGTVIIGKANSIGSSLADVHVFPVKYAELEDVRDAVAMLFIGNNGNGSTSNIAKAADNKEGNSTAKSSKKVKKGNGSANGSNSGGDNGNISNNQVSRTNRVSIDRGTGSILVYGTSGEAAEAEKLIKRLDVPAKQISLEAKVVSISKDASNKLGVSWEWSSLPNYAYDSDGNSTRTEDSSGNSKTVGGIIQFGKGPGSKPYEMYYSAKLEALLSKGNGNILSRPNVMTLQGHEAVINIGGDVPIPVTSVTNSTTTTSIEYRQSGIILRYTPYVNADGYITAKVHTEVSTPYYVDEMKAYRFQKRSADTIVRLKDGETMVIGGLIGAEEAHNMSKVPFLGDIPIIGNLFKSISKSKNENEVMIFLTAKVL